MPKQFKLEQSTMYRALGGYGGILCYMLHQIRSDVWSNVSNRAWWTWHLYVRCRSRDEIQEIIDERLEELTGDNHREWPDLAQVEKERDEAVQEIQHLYEESYGNKRSDY